MHVQTTLVVNRRLLEEIILNPGSNVEMDYSKSMFDLLHTQLGKTNCLNYFKERVLTAQVFMTENEMINFLRELTNLNDFEILDIIDTFDSNYTGNIIWKDFFLLVAAYSAYESKQTVKFLYKHNQKIFSLLHHNTDSNTNGELNFDQFASLANVFGIMEHELVTSILKDFKFHENKLRNQPIDQEHFTLYYFTTLKKLDTLGSVNEITAEDMLKYSPLCACQIQ